MITVINSNTKLCAKYKKQFYILLSLSSEFTGTFAAIVFFIFADAISVTDIIS